MNETTTARPTARRSLNALRKFVRDMKARAMAKGPTEIANAKWVFLYRPVDDAENEPIEITEGDFNGEDGSGHPRPGVYSARAVDPDTGEVVVDDLTGEWHGDVKDPSSSEVQEGNPLALQLAALTKSTTHLLEQHRLAESRADRRAAQAEAREEEVRKRLQATLDANTVLQEGEHNAKLGEARAVRDAETFKAERDAAIADLEEIKQKGGEWAPMGDALGYKLYKLACDHFDEPPKAFDKEAIEEAATDVAAKLLEFITIEHNGQQRRVILGLWLHYMMGFPWAPLRVLFFTMWDVNFVEAPPVDWQPPAAEPSAPAGEAVH